MAMTLVFSIVIVKTDWRKQADERVQALNKPGDLSHSSANTGTTEERTSLKKNRAVTRNKLSATNVIFIRSY
jgi:hypothetical protein